MLEIIFTEKEKSQFLNFDEVMNGFALVKLFPFSGYNAECISNLQKKRTGIILDKFSPHVVFSFTYTNVFL